MVDKKNPRNSQRQAGHPLIRAEIETWFKEAVTDQSQQPQAKTLDNLADRFKVLINRVNNAELGKGELVPFENLKDAQPDEEFRKRLNAIVSAVKKFQAYAGPVINTPGGDVYLAEFQKAVAMITAIYAPPEQRDVGPGRPKSPWTSAAKTFANLIRETLKASGYTGSSTLANPSSAPIIITTKAINHAYGLELQPEAIVSAFRERDRSKPTKSS